MTKLRTLRWRDYIELSKGAQGNHKGPYKREARESEKDGDVLMKAEVSMM